MAYIGRGHTTFDSVNDYDFALKDCLLEIKYLKELITIVTGSINRVESGEYVKGLKEDLRDYNERLISQKIILRTFIQDSSDV